jgi:hypothetical protein
LAGRFTHLLCDQTHNGVIVRELPWHLKHHGSHSPVEISLRVQAPGASPPPPAAGRPGEQHPGGDDAVEGSVGKRQVIGVADPERHIRLVGFRALLRLGDERCTQIDRQQDRERRAEL